MGVKRISIPKENREKLLVFNRLLRNQTLNKWNPSCPHCNSYHIIKKTDIKRERKGYAKKYLCRDCNSTFTFDNCFEWTHYPPRVVGDIFHLIAKGESYRDIIEFIKDRHGVEMDRKTVINISRYCTERLEMFRKKIDLKLLHPTVWEIDEIYLPRGKGKFFKALTVLDIDTGYILIIYVSNEIDYESAKKTIELALNNSIRPPRKFKCEKNAAIIKAASTLLPKKTKIDAKSKKEKFDHLNNIEGQNRKLRKTLKRGVAYRNKSTLQIRADIYRYDHNFFWRKQGPPPVYYAGINVPKNLTRERFLIAVDKFNKLNL
ncbi:hypothetical protein Ferp_0413 [Ferroglobus placidus DSM 10642]|uniref:DDE domain-containing protein n=1 Tax=Ferroglobus placidus (strain DSM 10642 / AEDII12DO) TaxID=589924 RepID=D3S2R0_FERPA|nr:DDE-type integrase/transposase/recombinase [Ferroglobus placidus]ADC64590.1 hypothetical protein Ferp_0413 [Ferroglobus placidus DSM 10642]